MCNPRFVLLILGLLVCSCAHADPRKLPAVAKMNKGAGISGLLIIKLRLESGEEMPFVVDTGTGTTAFDKTMEPKLGKALETTYLNHWGKKIEARVYAMPKLYLGDVPLTLGDKTVALDLHAMFGGADVAGIIGYDCLRNYCVQLDFESGELRFLDEKPNPAWGKPFPIVELNSKDDRPSVAQNLLGSKGPHSLIDSGCDYDGWLMPKYFQQWTNQAAAPTNAEARFPHAFFDGQKYPLVDIHDNDVESDGIGLHFLARHLVTLDFPEKKMYLQRRSIGPLPNPGLKATRMEALGPIIADVILDDTNAVRRELNRIEASSATEFEKKIARKLTSALDDHSKPAPTELPAGVSHLCLGDARPELAEVGWLKPSANRIPLNPEIPSPLLDSGKVYATGLFAHSPSRYVYNLGAQWKRLRGEAGLHTAVQGQAFGVVFVIKADGREVFRSEAIRDTDHARYDLDVASVKTLELLVEKAQDRNGANWALWLDPELLR